MKKITIEEVKSWPHLKRINFVNAATGFKSANMIGTMDGAGVENLAVFSSVTHLGSSPALVGFFLRPTTVPRNTFDNIQRTGYYTINHIPSSHFAAAHQTSAKYDYGVSEFEKCGFTSHYTEHIKAPYVKEARIKLGVKFVDAKDIEINGLKLIIGSIEEFLLDEDALLEDGLIDLEASLSVTISGLDRYHKTIELGRQPYARPGMESDL